MGDLTTFGRHFLRIVLASKNDICFILDNSIIPVGYFSGSLAILNISTLISILFSFSQAVSPPHHRSLSSARQAVVGAKLASCRNSRVVETRKLSKLAAARFSRRNSVRGSAGRWLFVTGRERLSLRPFSGAVLRVVCGHRYRQSGPVDTIGQIETSNRLSPTIRQFPFR